MFFGVLRSYGFLFRAGGAGEGPALPGVLLLGTFFGGVFFAGAFRARPAFDFVGLAGAFPFLRFPAGFSWIAMTKSGRGIAPRNARS